MLIYVQVYMKTPINCRLHMQYINDINHYLMRGFIVQVGHGLIVVPSNFVALTKLDYSSIGMKFSPNLK